MDNPDLTKRIEAFGQWKQDIIKSIKTYESWLDDNDMYDPDNNLRLMEILEALKGDRITIAFIAEVSSGKSELINSIFFADYKRRLLPSDVGRTTMCPTELFYDSNNDDPYIRLLPIETRLNETSIAEYKHRPIEWTTIKLDVSSADSMAEALEEVTQVKSVPVEEARRLQLYDDWAHHHAAQSDSPPSHIEIPKWRHALISFPHPLLEKGMVVLDTPGLNALGTEPELTLSMLPSAQGVLFLLGADTGVTKSELEMWKHHVQPYRGSNKRGLLVVLNKIDTLWDELKGEEAFEKSIQDQVRNTASMLDVPESNVFPVSAQKALVAKVKNDDELLGKSGISSLEKTLVEDILPEKHRIIQDTVLGDLSNMVDSSLQIVKARMDKVQKQFGELKNLSGKNTDVIEHLLKKTREEQLVYNKNVESLQDSRRQLSKHAKIMLDHLSIKAMDKLVSTTRDEMSKSWTTNGMKKGMQIFFDQISKNLNAAASQANDTLKLVNSIYHKFHTEHGLADIKPVPFSTARYQEQFDLLYREAELFRKSPVTTMTEQSFVVKKFFITLVSKARNIFFNAHHDAEKWTKTVMSPLITQIRDHKKEIEKRLDTLRKISDSRETLQDKMKELAKIHAGLNKQATFLKNMLELFNQPLDGKAAEDEAA